MKAVGKMDLWLFLSFLVLSVPAIASELDDVVPGHWVEVRGKLDKNGIFQAQRIELVDLQGSSIRVQNTHHDLFAK